MGRRGLGQLMGGSDVHPGHHEGSELSPLTEALCAALYICFAPGNFLSTHFPMTKCSDCPVPLARPGCHHQMAAWCSGPFSLHFHAYVFNDNIVWDFCFINDITRHIASCGLPVFYSIICLGIFPRLNASLVLILFIAS